VYSNFIGVYFAITMKLPVWIKLGCALCRSGCRHWSLIVQTLSRNVLLERLFRPWLSFVAYRSKSD